MTERRELESVIYEREPPIARIILNRPDKANTKDATLVQEVDACLHEADRDKEIKVVILKANGKGFCGGHVARWGPDENPYPDFGDTFEDLYKGTADLFLWPTLYLWEFPKPTISQIHGYCMGGGIYLGLLTDFCVASEDAYFQMPLAQSLGEPGGHTMIEPWLMMNWHRTMDWLLLAPTLSAQEALEWGLLNKVVPRDAARGHRRGDGPQDRPDPADHVDGGEEQREARVGTDGDARAPAGEPHPDEHGRRGVRCAGAPRRAHPVRLEAKGFRRRRGRLLRRADVNSHNPRGFVRLCVCSRGKSQRPAAWRAAT